MGHHQLFKSLLVVAPMLLCDSSHLIKQLKKIKQQPRTFSHQGIKVRAGSQTHEVVFKSMKRLLGSTTCRRCNLFLPRFRLYTTEVQHTLPPANPNKLLSLKPITPSDAFVSCTVFNSKGDVTAVSQKFPKWAFLRDHSLYPRDLRKIDTTAVDIIPSILVKPHCIVVNMLYIKALIEKDKVYVFDTANPSAAAKLGVLMYDLESKLSSRRGPAANGTAPQPYEHSALESMLINVMSDLETEYKTHLALCGHILSDLENEVDRDKLRDLLIKSKHLTLYYQKSLLIREMLDELLENDDDLAGMYLEVKKTEEDDFADLEMLLENYYTQCDEYVQQAESLIQDIKSTEEIVNIILDANRNALMLLELKVTIYTLGFTVATLVPAFYGMNLKNFIEDNNWGFASVVIFSVISALVVTGANFRALRSITTLTLLNNHTGAQSARHRRVASAYADEHIPLLWQRCRRWGSNLWHGKSGANRLRQGQEDRDIVWRWLLDDEKK
ncbi:related to Mitochondrial inner membrane magnesium transporter mrs2 [Zygosaccharomyces bailii]|nr:related to Mitochondrial inner membrane magnesium transporter mrs2 [Zygosaccharomyces bailii]